MNKNARNYKGNETDGQVDQIEDPEFRDAATTSKRYTFAKHSEV
jgi:hypothetical protein